jgi:hypothetical protein
VLALAAAAGRSRLDGVVTARCTGLAPARAGGRALWRAK